MIDAKTCLSCAIAAALPMGIAALFALRLPPETLALFALIGMVRLGWVDDNIANDLLDADRLPIGYINTFKRRQAVAWRLLGLRPVRDPAVVDPALLATRYRAEAQVLQSALLTGLAVSGAQLMPTPMAIPFFVVTFVAAWRQMARLSTTLLTLETGRPLSRRQLLSRVRWAGSWLPDSDR